MITLAQRSQLTVLYSEEHRHYHTLAHVQSCLRELDELCTHVLLSKEERDTLETAIWFHDAVYDPKASKGSNEAESIRLLYSCSLTGVSFYRVEELIVSTINHQIPDDEDPVNAKLMGLFLDIDLAVLGRPSAEYDKYAAQIKAEYAWVPDEDYRAARRQLLVGFLSRKRIYFTDYFYQKYEVQARTNLRCEATSLVPNRLVKIQERP